MRDTAVNEIRRKQHLMIFSVKGIYLIKSTLYDDFVTSARVKQFFMFTDYYQWLKPNIYLEILNPSIQ